MCELDKLRLASIASDPTVLTIRRGTELSLIESELLYLNRPSASDDDTIVERLRAVGGHPVSTEHWCGRSPREERSRVDASLSHMRDELRYELWDLSAARTQNQRFNIYELVEQAGGRLSPLTVYAKAPGHWGPYGTPTLGRRPRSLGDAHATASINLAVLDTGVPADYAALHPHLSAAVQTPVSLADVDTPLYVADPARDDLMIDAAHGLFILDVAYRVGPSLLPVYMRRVGRDDTGFTFGEQQILNDLVDVVTRAEAAGGNLIVNMSFGAQTLDNAPPPGPLSAYISNLSGNEHVLFVVAAGNNGDDRKTWPAALPYENVVSVGALDPDDRVAAFSSRGDWVDCWALGADVTGAYVPGTAIPYSGPGQGSLFPSRDPWAVWQGTSFAAPFAAAAIANQAAGMGRGTTLQAAWQALRFANHGNRPSWVDAGGGVREEAGCIIDAL